VSEGNPEEPVTVTDKRRIDPETGEVRHVASGAAPSGAAPEARGAAPGTAEDPVNDEKVAELTADLQRVQADYANYRKRALRDQEATAERAKAAVMNQLLGVLDDLERARSHGDLDSGPLKSVADKLVGALTGLGLTGFGAEGDDFDPALHEAVQHEGDGGEGSRPVIGTVMRQGYKLGEQVLRHALVGVVDTVADDSATTDTADNEANEGEQNAESEPSEK
jgi:molecular chaperone GrpE